LVVCFLFLQATFSKIYFQEKFDDDWEKRWVKSFPKKDEDGDGEWAVSAGKFYNDAEADKGLQTTEDAKFYTISAEMEDFSNRDKTLVLQFIVKHEQNIDCGGGYVKLIPASALDNQEDFGPNTEYNIMFGPDICGSSTKRTHVIFTHDGTNHLIKKDVKCETDEYSHLYRLVVNPDNTYSVSIDGEEKESGSLEEDWDMLPPKEIEDPEAEKPADWVDEKQIPDPEDSKPEGWDDIPAEIADPDAEKPDDWDDELDGEWEAPMIPNPEFKGEWKPKMIDNPEYKGEWEHPMIPNPDFKEDPDLYAYDSHKYLGIEIWQVKAGTIFDDFIVTDSVEEADAFAKDFESRVEGEKAMKKEQDEELKKKQEEERKAKEAEEEEEDEGIVEADDELDEEDKAEL